MTNRTEWHEQAYASLLAYATTHHEFLVEDVRAAHPELTDAPGKGRAWGGVVKRAVAAGILKHVGFSRTKGDAISNPTHRSLWRVVSRPAVQQQLF